MIEKIYSGDTFGIGMLELIVSQEVGKHERDILYKLAENIQGTCEREGLSSDVKAIYCGLLAGMLVADDLQTNRVDELIHGKN